jgi:hypothetical protein
MTEYFTATDIGNRALQHVGAQRMDPVLGLSDTSSRGAAEISFCYGKLRRAELQRNNWKFAIRRTALRSIQTNTTNNTDTLLLQAALWSSLTTYFVGSIVADQNGTLWQSKIRNNLGNQPLSSPGWEEYFGPMSVSAWDTSGSTAYFAGELVYTTAGAGATNVYVSLIEGNSDNPATATAWSATATYYKNQIVTFASVAYMSLIDLNIDQEPDLAPALWAIGTTYAAGNKVGGSDGAIYQSVGSGNIGHDPTTDGGVHWTATGVANPWTTVFVSGTGSVNWRQIGGAAFPNGVGVAPLNIIYPLGAGPSFQATTRNVFRLPAGFLRKVPQDPKAGSQSWLGAPSGGEYDDWNIEGRYLTSRRSDAILLRFVTDTIDVASFDDMFCEGLAARIALEICEPVTQSAAKQGAITQEYQKFMGEAREINAIETGPEEPPVDDYISCRL